MVLSNMTEIRFYHLQRSTMKQALPGILEKALERSMRVVIHLADKAQVKDLDNWLWAYKPESFLPHGCDGDPEPSEHPIWLTTTHDNPNKADLVIVADALPWEGTMDGIKMRCEFFDGTNEAIVSSARKNWAQFQKEDYELSYWQQDDQGRWQQKK